MPMMDINKFERMIFLEMNDGIGSFYE